MISAADRLAVWRALGNSHLTQGTEVSRFESAVANLVGAQFGVAVNSATSALHLACITLGVSEDDIVWTTSISFVASANCALYTGAKVEFVDIDHSDFNISVEALESRLKVAARFKRLPSVVIVVHLGGCPAKMREIWNLGQKYGFKIIEDASQALGAYYEDSRVGSCLYSEITVFSFHAVKNITTGEGGIALTNSKNHASKMALLRSHGISRNPAEYLAQPSNLSFWYYEQLDLGMNYRLTDFQCALGMSQLKKIDRFNRARARILEQYRRHLEGGNIRFQTISDNVTSSYHLAIVRFDSGQIRDRVAERLLTDGFRVALHYPPIHLQPVYRNAKKHHLGEAEAYGHDALSLPCHPKLRRRDVKKVIRSVRLTLRDFAS